MVSMTSNADEVQAIAYRDRQIRQFATGMLDTIAAYKQSRIGQDTYIASMRERWSLCRQFDVEAEVRQSMAAELVRLQRQARWSL